LTPTVREEVTVELAELLIGRQAFADALARLDACPFESTELERIAELRAECEIGLGHAALAAEHLAARSEHEPSPRRLRLEAKLRSDAGELGRAAASLERALQAAPHDLACREQLAHLYEQQDKRAAAGQQRQLLAESRKLYTSLSELKQKANRRANDAEVRRQLAGLCERLGKQEWAARWLRAAAMCPKQDDVQDE